MVREEVWEDIGKRCGEDRGGEGRGVGRIGLLIR